MYDTREEETYLLYSELGLSPCFFFYLFAYHINHYSGTRYWQDRVVNLDRTGTELLKACYGLLVLFIIRPPQVLVPGHSTVLRSYV